MAYEYARAARDRLAKPIKTGFKVGAVAFDHDGDMFPAGNVEHENSALNMCAERLALMNARMRGSNPRILVLVTDEDEPTFPCGVCRQYMTAFPKLRVTTYSKDGTKSVTKTIEQLFPNPYKRKR